MELNSVLDHLQLFYAFYPIDILTPYSLYTSSSYSIIYD
jgi:hypothetical protein